MPLSSSMLSSPPISADPPLGLDPREPPVSPRIGSRTPTRGTPISSRAASPSAHSHGLHLGSSSHLNPAGAHPFSSAGFGSIPSSPTSTHSRHIHSREEDADSSLFERDVESLEFATIPSSTLAHSTSSSALAAGAPASPGQAHFSPARPASASPAIHQHSHIHHPHARASATDQVFPTVLDDAVEALAGSTGDVFVVSPSRSGSPSGLPGRRSFGVAGGVEGLMYEGGTSSGQRSPVVSFSSGKEEGRERRSSTVSLTGQAGRMLDNSDGAGGSQGFRLTLPGEDHPTLVPISAPTSNHSSPPLASGSPSTFANASSSNPAVNPNAHRISFISPQDLIVSPPLSTLSLSSITSGASAPTSVSTPSGSAAQSPSVVPAHEAGSPPTSAEAKGGDEWAREGLGKGLESRLENLLREEGAADSGASGRVVSPAP